MNKTVKNSVIYTGGTIVMALIGFVSQMVLTRVLSQEVYAEYGLLSSFSTMVIMLISFGYDASYMRFYYNHGYSQKKFMLMSLKVPMIACLVFALVVLEPKHFLVNYIFGEQLPILTIVILLLYIFFSFVFRFSQLTARMEEYAGNYVVSNILSKSAFVLLVAVAALIFHNVSFDIVLISFAVSSVAAVLVNIYVMMKVFGKKSISEGGVTDRQLFSYGFPFMITNTLVLVIPLIEKLLVRDLAGEIVLSIFTAAAIFQTVILLISNTLENIWNPLVYKHCNEPKYLKPIMHTIGFVSTIVVTVGLAACILLRRWLVLLLGSDYYSVYIIAPVILFGACINVVSIVYSVGINIEKKTSHLIISPIIQAVISVVLCYLLIPSMGLIGVGIASFASILVSRLYRMIVGLKYYNTGVSEWKSGILCVIGSAVSIASMFFVSLPADIVMCAILLAATALIINKDIIALMKNIRQVVTKK